MSQLVTSKFWDTKNKFQSPARGLMHPLGYWETLNHYHAGFDVDGITAPSGGSSIVTFSASPGSSGQGWLNPNVTCVLAKNGVSVSQIGVTNRRADCARIIRRGELTSLYNLQKQFAITNELPFEWWNVTDIGSKVPIASTKLTPSEFPAMDDSVLWEFFSYNHATRSVDVDDWLLLVFDGDVETDSPFPPWVGDPLGSNGDLAGIQFPTYTTTYSQPVFKRGGTWYRRTFRIDTVSSRLSYSSADVFSKVASSTNTSLAQAVWNNTYDQISFTTNSGLLRTRGTVNRTGTFLPWDGYSFTEGGSLHYGFLPATGVVANVEPIEYLGGDLARTDFLANGCYVGAKSGTVTVPSGTYPVGPVFSQLPSGSSIAVPSACEDGDAFTRGWSYRGQCGYKIEPVGDLVSSPRRAIMPSGLSIELTYPDAKGSLTKQTTDMRRLTIEDVDDMQDYFYVVIGSPIRSVALKPGYNATTEGFESWIGTTATGGVVIVKPSDYEYFGEPFYSVTSLAILHKNQDLNDRWTNSTLSLSDPDADPGVSVVRNNHEPVQTVALSPFKATQLACGYRHQVIDGDVNVSPTKYFSDSVSAVITPGTAPALPTLRPNVVTLVSNYVQIDGVYFECSIDSSAKRIVTANNSGSYTGTFRTSNGSHTISITVPGGSVPRWYSYVGSNKTGVSLTNSLSFSTPFVDKVTLELAGSFPPVPTANFEGSPLTINVGETVTFTDKSSNATSWSYTFGDGNTSTLQNPTNTYVTAGKFTVTQKVTNATWHDTKTRTDYVTVYNEDPIADFTAMPLTVAVGEDVFFSDASTPFGGIDTYSWDFGDGKSSTEANPVHAYGSAGKKTVSLTVTNFSVAGSDTKTRTDYIEVDYINVT
jgi:PKD repeat protein